MGFFIQDAMAQAAAPPAQDPWVSLLPMFIILLVIYFMIMRPQQKRQKEHKAMMAALAVGDEVCTAGGMLGKVTSIKDDFLHVEIASGVEVIVQRHTISAVMPKGTIKNA
ncbi:MAG: preprotein translocase subunit YajC [Gammaproteobacteria bacterium]|nr:preprotein translocase subunit YajC [Gammaproteobacteria bacterium]